MDYVNVDVGFVGSIVLIFLGVFFIVCGCIDLLAINYDFIVNFDDGICIYFFGCGDFFYDLGGLGGQYFNQENMIIIICLDIFGDLVEVIFSIFDFEGFFDDLIIYDGLNISFLIIGIFSNNSLGIVIFSYFFGCLIFVFDSDFSGIGNGWVVFVDCVQFCILLLFLIVILVQVCQGESVMFLVVVCFGGMICWYISFIGGSLIVSGLVYNIFVFNNNIIYYVVCDIGDCVLDCVVVFVIVVFLVMFFFIFIGLFCQGVFLLLLLNVQDGVLGIWSGIGVNVGIFILFINGVFVLIFIFLLGECVLFVVLVVEVFQNFVFDIIGLDVICDGNFEFLSVFGNFVSYFWNINDVIQIILIFSLGIYFVIVMIQFGNCIGEFFFMVGESFVFVLMISGDF